VTLHQLLTHTSGLPESVGDDFDLITPKELLMQSLSRRKYPWQNNFSYELISKFHLGKP
jgi:CubicO group peptidase (beta-lactamase class C family)